MKRIVHISPTEQIETINGNPHRVWVGNTDNGDEVLFVVACVRVAAPAADRFRNLKEITADIARAGAAMLGYRYFL